MSVRGLVAATVDGGWVPFYDPGRDPVRTITDEHLLAVELFEVVAWGMTIVFSLTDVLTTILGLGHPALTEAVPASRWVIGRYGWLGLAVEHAVVLAILVGLWRLLPKPYRLVVPLEGAWAGYIIAHGNLVLLLTHEVLAPL